MFKKSKGKVLVDEASEEDDVSWHHEHAIDKDKDSEGTEEVLSPSTKDSKLKKVKSKRERGDKKLFPSQDDEQILLTGQTVSPRKGSAKKGWDEEKGKVPSDNKAQCLWDNITMSMKQITPTRKPDKMECWEPPQMSNRTEEKSESEKKLDSSPLSSNLSLSLPSWVGLGLEEDSSRYASLTESQTGGPAQWAARARDKLAAVRRKSPASLSESTWEGLK